LGKIKTALQLTAIGSLFSYPTWSSHQFFYDIGVLGLNFSAFLGWVGFFKYCLLLSRNLTFEDKNKTQ
jgi:hypothetical protein